MLDQTAGQLLQDHPLVQFTQPDNFVGWIYSIDYDRAMVMTNDLWKADARGVPHNCFLVASTFDPARFNDSHLDEREVIVLRVIGSAKLPQDDDLVRTKIDHFQQQEEIYQRPVGAEETMRRDFDDITRSQMQFGGLECRVLGTFFVRGDALWLGSDLESFSTATRLRVYRPRGDALQAIVNHIDPNRRQAALDEARGLGIEQAVAPLRVGTVRYTSTDRLHRAGDDELVPVFIQPSDFLARRTAVLGMTRTGKSNMVKQTVAVVKRVADQSGVQIGQIIYDINGEYANANQQDRGSIADIYPSDTIRYRMLQTPGFLELQNNFYAQIDEGFALIQRVLREAKRDTVDYVRAFLNMSLDEPSAEDGQGERIRWARKLAAYKVLLYKAGFEPPNGHAVNFAANRNVRTVVDDVAGEDLGDPAHGLTLARAAQWFEAAREANQQNPLPGSSAGSVWVDDTLQVLLDMIAMRRGANSFISGHRILADALRYHSPRRDREVGEEIYEHLRAGRIVILDLSVGDPTLRESLSKQIASHIFNASMARFVRSEQPPNILVYIEEAHNLIGKGMELTETWPRLAKEGAKYRIGLVYATQEVSSVHPNILANTENWFVTHLNNDREIRELAHFYDFSDFSRSLLRAQDVGFARVKMLSGPFVVPVQIDRFNPEAARAASAAAE